MFCCFYTNMPDHSTSSHQSYRTKKLHYKDYMKPHVALLKSVQVMVRLHIFPIFSFLAKMLSYLLRARNENIGKICKLTITWTDFTSTVYIILIHDNTYYLIHYMYMQVVRAYSFSNYGCFSTKEFEEASTFKKAWLFS